MRRAIPAPDGSTARRVLEGAAATAAGVSLFAAAAAIERAFSAGPAASAAIEELGKWGLIVVAALGAGSRKRGGAGGRRGASARERRLGRLAEARRISLALVATAVFAAAENLAYFAAFREAGVLGRLLWSMPVHLSAALAEALGALGLAGAWSRPAAAEHAGRLGVGALRDAAFAAARRARRPLACLASLAAGTAIHAAANAVASGPAGRVAPVIGAFAGLPILAALAAAFVDRAYIGGFLHGTD